METAFLLRVGIKRESSTNILETGIWEVQRPCGNNLLGIQEFMLKTGVFEIPDGRRWAAETEKTNPDLWTWSQNFKRLLNWMEVPSWDNLYLQQLLSAFLESSSIQLVFSKPLLNAYCAQLDSGVRVVKVSHDPALVSLYNWRRWFLIYRVCRRLD